MKKISLTIILSLSTITLLLLLLRSIETKTEDSTQIVRIDTIYVDRHDTVFVYKPISVKEKSKYSKTISVPVEEDIVLRYYRSILMDEKVNIYDPVFKKIVDENNIISIHYWREDVRKSQQDLQASVFSP